jgi:predicted PurR-regulated permease PerM
VATSSSDSDRIAQSTPPDRTAPVNLPAIDSPETPLEEEFEASRATRPIVAIIVATAVLYLGREILAPITAAVILAVIFSPIVSRLERFVGRMVSSAVVVLIAIAVLGVALYFVTVELTKVAAEVASYSNNIATKLTAIGQHTPEWLQRVEYGIADVQHQLQKSSSKENKQTNTIVETSKSSFTDLLQPAIPVITGIIDIFLVLILLFFLLVGSSDLRERFVRLAARAKITISAEAIQTAVGTVSRYLLYYSLINLTFGTLVGLMLWLIGLSHPGFWGGFAFMARFIPYIGAILSAVLPALVAFAIFPGWAHTIEILGAYVVLDQISAQLLEPFLIGSGIGVAPVALLISAIYWAWLWGPIGLLISTPLAACLKIAGDYIEPLNFLSLLLGAHTKGEDHQAYYTKLLELDAEGARSFAIKYSDQHGLERTIIDLLLPTLELAGTEREQDHISQEVALFIANSTREIAKELGDRLNAGRLPARARLLGVCPPGEKRFVELLLLLELLRQEGVAAGFAGENSTIPQIREFAHQFRPDQIYLFCATPDCLPAALELTQDLHRDFPATVIVGTGAAVQSASVELLKAGCARISEGFNETRRIARSLIRQRRPSVVRVR